MEQRSSECSLLARGQLRLRIKICQEILIVFVYEANHLKHRKLTANLCNIFIKVSVIPKDDSSVVCQTKEVSGSDSPTTFKFNEFLTYQILPGDSKKRLWITAWCKDNSNEQTDLIGCMSFGMKHLQAKTQKKPVEGWFCLLSESVGRRKHIRTPMSNASTSDGTKELVPGKGGLLPVNLQLRSMMPVMIVMHKHPSGFGFTLRGSCPVCVGMVEPHSSAALAGLSSGDYIESVNGQNVSRSSAESVAAIVKSTDQILILDIYRQNHCPNRYSVFEQDENLPVHVEASDSYGNPKKPIPEDFQLIGKSQTRYSQKATVWCHQGAGESSSECTDSDSRMIKRRRLDRMRTFRSQIETTIDYNIFVRREDRIKEVIYEEINEGLPTHCYRRDEVMSCASEKCLAPSTLPDSGVSSAAASVASELDKGLFVPKPAMNNDLMWNPFMSAISRTLPVLSPLRWIASDSDCSFTKVATGGFDPVEEMSHSNEMSDRMDNKAFLSDTTFLNDERVNSTQVLHSCTPSSELCDIILHRFLSCEENFIGSILSGVQRFSWPLRHCILSRHQHSALFQNIEKLMVLSEVNVRSLWDLCSCDNKRTNGANESAIAILYTSKLKLTSQAYSQYFAGMTSSWQVLRELRRCPEFLTFIQKADDKSELKMETFLQQPFKHLQDMIAEFRFLVQHSSSSSDDLKAFQTVASTLIDLLQTPSAMNDAEHDVISAPNSPEEQMGTKAAIELTSRKIDQETRTSSDDHRKPNSTKTEFYS